MVVVLAFHTLINARTCTYPDLVVALHQELRRQVQVLDSSMRHLQQQAHRRASSQDTGAADTLFGKVPCLVVHASCMQTAQETLCAALCAAWACAAQAAEVREERQRLMQQAEQLEQYERCVDQGFFTSFFYNQVGCVGAHMLTTEQRTWSTASRWSFTAAAWIAPCCVWVPSCKRRGCVEVRSGACYRPQY